MNSLGSMFVCKICVSFDNIKGDEANFRFRNDKVLQFYH